MAYKDEYEVARLYTDPVFLSVSGKHSRRTSLGLPVRFTGPRAAKPRLAPDETQLARRCRPCGHAYRYARLANPLDPFGKTAERRRERQWVEDYFALLDEFQRSLTRADFP